MEQHLLGILKVLNLCNFTEINDENLIENFVNMSRLVAKFSIDFRHKSQ